MRKFQSAFIMLLAAAVILVGAYLPRIAGAIGDQLRNEKVSYAPMQSVQLDFGSTEQRDSEYMIKKLALEQNMNTLPITAEEASMTEEEVFVAVEKCMDAYASGGIFQWFQDSYRMAEPYLAISRDNTDNVSVIWAVHIVHEDDPYRNLFLHMDDETGAILYLDYVTYDPESTFYPEDQAHAVNTLAELYFEQLGLTELADPFTSQKVTVDEMLDNDIRCLRYSFADTQYGGVVIEFYCRPNGFYILFPN